MDRFCQHCGKELKGDELRCPECGMPIDPSPYQPSLQPTYAAPPRKRTNAWIIVVAVVAVLCIALIALIPSLIPTKDTYTVTVTVEEFSITVEDKSQYGMATTLDAELGITCGDASATIGPWKDCKIDGTKISPPSGNKAVFKISTSDLTEVKYTVFLNIISSYPGGTITDTVDLYSVDTSKVTSPIPKAFGCSGVVMNVEDYQNGSTVVLKGDTDPIGYVKLSFKSVKN